jgi:uncharacterized membrane protein YheB (UPF0754 family)
MPPVAGTIVGYFTNDIAIRMLFRPYRPVFVGKYQLPFTPGLIPRNQSKLAKRIADAIVGSLLTPAEIQKIAKRLLVVDRIKVVVAWLLNLALAQIKTESELRTIGTLANILKDLFRESLPRLLRVWARKPTFLNEQIGQIFDLVLLEFDLTGEQAGQLSKWLVKTVLAPDVLRQGLIDFLTDRNIQILDERLRQQSSGTYWILANTIGLRGTLVQLRNFCLDERVATERIFIELIENLKIQQNLQEWLLNLSLQNLPDATVEQLRTDLIKIVREYIQSKGSEAIRTLGETIDWEELAAIVFKRLRASSVLLASIDPIGEELAAIVDRYLETDLESTVSKIIPILDLEGVIIDQIEATPAADLEAGVNAIVKSELQSIVNLGGILGGIVGFMQTAILWFTRSA